MSKRIPILMARTLIVCACFALNSATAQQVIVIKAGRLIDGTGRPAIENATIVIQGQRISSVQASGAQIPAGSRIIDLSNETVMPGLINGHDHPTIRASNTGLQGQLDEMAEQPAQQAARGVRDLRTDLLLGVTTEYVVGEVNYNDIYLKKMVDSGAIPGPRILASGPWIIPTAGYRPIPETNGPWAMRERVRKSLQDGADHIKVVVSRVLPAGPNAGHPYGQGTDFTKEEIDAVVDEAHRLGMKVTAHAIDASSIRFALDAGVDSIQHAWELTPEMVDLFVKHRAGIINTFVISNMDHFTNEDYEYLDGEANTPSDWINHCRAIIDKALSENKKMMFSEQSLQDFLRQRYGQLKMAKERGIPIAVGTDNMQGMLDLELEHLVNAGFTPLEAISAGTGTGAKALGIGETVGTIEKGKYADIISVRGKPDQNIRDLSNVNLVMVGGKVFSGLSFR